MNFKELVTQNRTRRKFDQSRPMDVETLVELVDLARFVPSGMNKQPLKYIVCADMKLCDEVFPLLGWAGYLKDWSGPAEGQRPTGYIIVMLDKDISDSAGCDHGIVCQTLMLGAVEKGYGGCIIATVNRKKLTKIFDIPENFEVLMVLALGVPAEEVLIEPLPSDGKIEYWRGTDGKHHVPKRGLDELLVAMYPKNE